MKSGKRSYYINSMYDLKKEQQLVRARILEKEDALRKRVQQLPGELFFSGVDSVIPSMLTGKVSNFALNAGKGLINNFFVKKAVSTSGFKILDVIKPSGIFKKIQSGYKAITRLKK
ncbi:MAG TPA: hypothetical protein VEZ17_01785 [Chitinophagaceae bacterium]|jgi:hypothetical protein|nr:hypothetical protein [Chitinophagaceae bacterium]